MPFSCSHAHPAQPAHCRSLIQIPALSTASPPLPPHLDTLTTLPFTLRRRRVAAACHPLVFGRRTDTVAARPVETGLHLAGPSDRDYRKEQSTPPVPRLHRYFATRARARHGLLQPQPHGFSQALVDGHPHGPQTLHLQL
jgi:hypothetical protein